MAYSLNTITLVGKLGKPAEIKTGNNNSEFATFSIATEESYPDKKNPGQFVRNTYWHECNASFPNMVKELQKAQTGDWILVKGMLTYRDSADQQGNRRRFYTVRAEELMVFPKGASARNPQDDLPEQYVPQSPYPQGVPYQPQGYAPQGYAPQPPQNYPQEYQQSAPMPNGGYAPQKKNFR